VTNAEGYAALDDMGVRPPFDREGMQILRARAGSAIVTFTMEVTPPTN